MNNIMIGIGFLLIITIFIIIFLRPAIFKPEDIDPVVKFLKRRATNRSARDMRKQRGPVDRNS